MIGVLAVLAALSAEALAAWVVSTWTAAGFDEASPIGAVSVPSFLAVMHTAYWLPRALESLAVPVRWGYTVLAVVGFVVLYGIFRLEFGGDFRIWDFHWALDFANSRENVRDDAGPALIGALLLVATWARGAWRATDDVELEEVPRRLAIPFGVVLLVCIIGAWTDRADAIARASVVFFAVGVAALASSQSALSGATIGTIRSGGVTTMLLAGTAVVAVLGVFVTWVVFGLLGETLGDVISTVIIAILTVVLTPIVWVVDAIISFLLGGGAASQSPVEPNLPEGPPTLEADSDGGALPEEAGVAWRLLLLLALGAAGVAAIVVVTHLRRRVRQRRQVPAAVDRAGSFSGDLRSLFGNIFGRRGPQQPVTGEGAVRLYTELLREAEHRGQPRQPGQTPVELMPSLARTFPRAPVDEITRVFDDARYGDHPPDPAMLEDLRRRWEAGREPGET